MSRPTGLPHLANWKHLALPVAVLYLPGFAMACLMTATVSCNHCIRTAWWLVPAGPGFLLGEVFRQLLGWNRGGDWATYGGGIAMCIVAVLGLLAARRLPRWVWGGLHLVAFVGASFLAFVLYRLIRM